MKILITTPSFAVHGGIRIILEWANRLSDYHEVHLYNLEGQHECNWFKIKDSVKHINGTLHVKHFDCLIITSPHSIDLLDIPDVPRKTFIFAQMAEHLFCDPDSKNYKKWYSQCQRFYLAPYPMFAISQWNMDLFKSMGRTHETHYIGNGVNFEDFPISYKPKDFKTILVEGWEPTNPSKDVNNIGPKVAKKLKEKGYKIIAYSQLPLKTMPEVPDEYYVKPSLSKLNELYERATVMIKATKYDARSCAPVEAMTKSTVTFRALNKGDDDLIHNENCIKIRYDNKDIEDIMILEIDNMLHLRKEYINELSMNCRKYVQEYCNWDKIIITINKILNNEN